MVRQSLLLLTTALAAALSGCGAALPGASLAQAAALITDETALSEDVEEVGTEEVPAEDPPQAPIARTGTYESRFEADRDGEGLMTLTAAGVGTSWGKEGRESAVVSVFVDGAPNQDIILCRGSAPEQYQVLLGPIARGEHTLEVRFRSDLSRPGAMGAFITGATTKIVGKGQPGYDALAGAPIIYARPDANRSDTPLFLTYDHVATGYRYTMVVSNEDGGTPAADLMAVWGRACDIDWCYRQSGSGRGGFIQGFLHRTLAFRGRYEGTHPVLRVSTNNNMVSDQGTSRFKLRLPLIQAPTGARERALESFAWAYKLTAQELAREGKIRTEREPLLSRIIGKQIADMRRYVTIEFEHQDDTRLGFRLQVEGNPDWFTSHSGRWHRTIKRTGTVRTTVELPPGATPARITRLQAITSSGKPYGLAVRIVRAFGFDNEYRPVPLPANLGVGGP